MVTQLNRVNGEKSVDERLQEALDEIARLKRENTELLEAWERERNGRDPSSQSQTLSPASWKRQHRASESVSTINRALHDGRLQGYQDENGNWHVPSHATITPAHRGRRKSEK